MLCKLFQHTCFALTLIALARDIESNPGYLTFDDYSLENHSLHLEGIDNKTINALCLKLGWTALQAMWKLNFLGLCVLDKTALERKKDMVVLQFISGKDQHFVYGMTLTLAARNVYGLS
ncbi:unnamed protein product [Porites evermanni]|uniref:Uncharacterized protein n=1 Tax=Porites evermanni TaxID=104178 RepID=A0ABN8QUY3_9CNID|nr:unnamed protein product [Porites evermanni]